MENKEIDITSEFMPMYRLTPDLVFEILNCSSIGQKIRDYEYKNGTKPDKMIIHLGGFKLFGIDVEFR